MRRTQTERHSPDAVSFIVASKPRLEMIFTSFVAEVTVGSKRSFADSIIKFTLLEWTPRFPSSLVSISLTHEEQVIPLIDTVDSTIFLLTPSFGRLAINPISISPPAPWTLCSNFEDVLLFFGMTLVGAAATGSQAPASKPKSSISSFILATIDEVAEEFNGSLLKVTRAVPWRWFTTASNTPSSASRPVCIVLEQLPQCIPLTRTSTTLRSVMVTEGSEWCASAG
mmetsp:Transcript_13106/g.32113  ORF Transcript_13106/g.32113 Transcript_13106/m.32113 type:complete len:226 (+) Transcript_13106:3100-3777(+)